MSTVTGIRDAIRKLPPKQAWQLAAELRQHLDTLWDKQFEDDVKSGRLDNLIERARKEHARGKPDRWMKPSATSEFWQLCRRLPTQDAYI